MVSDRRESWRLAGFAVAIAAVLVVTLAADEAAGYRPGFRSTSASTFGVLPEKAGHLGSVYGCVFWEVKAEWWLACCEGPRATPGWPSPWLSACLVKPPPLVGVRYCGLWACKWRGTLADLATIEGPLFQ